MSLSISSAVSSDSPSLDDSVAAQVKAAVANYEQLYESALASIQQMLQQTFAQDGISVSDLSGTGGALGSGATAQGAAGALAGYMHDNGINTLTPDQLYQMACNPGAGTPAEVSAAARFMLQNPDVFNQIETHDVAGADGIAGLNDFDWAAQGGLDASDPAKSPDPASFDLEADSGSQMSTQGAAGALASYMHDNGINTLTPNQLYQMAYNPGANTTPEVSQAAKTMLADADVFNQIETHDVAGADGVAGVNDFDWAAQGGLDQANNA